MVKNLPANAGDVDFIPGQEDPLEKEMATHSCILAWRIPGTEKPGGLQSLAWQRSQTQLSDQTTTIATKNQSHGSRITPNSKKTNKMSIS